MISYNDAKKIIAGTVSGHINNAFEYKKTHYVFNIPDPSHPYGNPFYAVSKKTGMVTVISPLEDSESFFNDMKKHPMEV